ncbi:kinase-like protein [Xylariaceae sp. AK1471]|nr:kinase-like protein [Xylariaceae sp. AK1471]
MELHAALPEYVRDSRWEVEFQPNPSYPIRILNTQSSGRRLIRREIWTREKRLGHGGFGVIWLERAHANSQLSPGVRAVKELRFGKNHEHRKECIRELEALLKFSQRKFESQDSLFIAMEFCEHGDLKNHICEHGHLSEPQAQNITDQILQGLIFMHENGFAHRDLKPANILIKQKPPDNEWHIKICDMGLTKRVASCMDSTTVRATPGFMPPERIPGLGENPQAADPFACDMWCLGEILFFLLTSDMTFHDYWKLRSYVDGTLGFPLEPLERVDASRFAIEFIQLLMAINPSERLCTASRRPSMDKIFACGG